MGAVAFNAFRRLPKLLAGHLPDAFKLSARHMHNAAALAAIFAFVSDALSPLYPSIDWSLFILGIVAAIGAYLAASMERLHPKSAAFVIMLCGSTSILSLGALAWHAIAGEGPIPQLIAQVSKLDADAQLADKHIEYTSSLLDITNKEIKQTNEKITLLLNSLDAEQKSRLYQVSLTAGISIQVVVMLQSHITASPIGADQAKANALLLQNAALYSSLEQALAGLKATDYRTAALLHQARVALAQADLGDASRLIREVAAINSGSALALADMARGRALDASRALQRAADVSKIALQYRAAANDLRDASRLAAPYDPRLAWQLTTQRADTLVQQADQLGDTAALGEAADVYSDALSMVSKNPGGQEFIRSRDNLSQAVARLNQNPALAGRHQSAIEALNRAGNPIAAAGPSGGASRWTRNTAGPSELNPGAVQKTAGPGRSAAPEASRSRADELMRAQNPTVAGARRHRGLASSLATTGTNPVAQPTPAQSSDDGGFFGRIKKWVGGGSSQTANQPAAQSATGAADTQNALANLTGGKHGRKNSLGSATTPSPSLGSTPTFKSKHAKSSSK
ncbi:MAG: hypothetical protein ACREHE_10985 [Rhizomicrobium sp.]